MNVQRGRSTVSELVAGLALFAVGFVGAFLVTTFAFSRRDRSRALAAEPELAIVPEGREREALAETLEREMETAPPIAETPAEVPALVAAVAVAQSPEDRAAKLHAAYESGRISREAYESNLAKLGLSPAPAAAAPPAPAPPPALPLLAWEMRAKKVERLRTAFAERRIARPVYEENLRKLGVDPDLEPEPDEPPVPSPSVPPPPAPPGPPALDAAARAAKLKAAHEAGRLSLTAYHENLRRLGLEVAPMAQPTEERAARLTEAYRAGRIPRALYERNVRALGLEPEPEVVPQPEIGPETPPRPAPPAPPSTPEARLVRLEAAFTAGKISREAYEANARALGFDVTVPDAEPPAPVEDERVARLHRAHREGRLPRELYERNVRALGGEPEPAPEAPRAEAPSTEARLAKVRAAYESGKLSREAYERNVRALGGTVEAPVSVAPPTPPAPPPAPPIEERAAKLRGAFEAGRISREQYAENLRRMGLTVPEEALPPPPPAEEPAVADVPVANPPAPRFAPAPADLDERIDLLTAMFVEGKLSRGVYERNLARAYEASEPRLAALRAAHESGRITRDVYDANVRRVLQERGAP